MSNLNETILHIDLKKLTHNFNYLKEKLSKKTKIIGVVKAFAYGHGDIKISKKLEELGVYALWVSDFEEGIILRKSGICAKIIVANPGIKSYDAIIKHKLDVLLYNQRLLDLYCKKKNNVNIHIKFNTGMNRYGFESYEVKSIISKIKRNSHLNLDSICSHLSTTNNQTKINLAKIQISKFALISQEFELLFGKKIYKHILNSNGVLNFSNNKICIARLGIGLYGSAADKNLKQISCFTSCITQIRNLKKGDFVGYGPSFFTKKKMTMAIVPVGYADGLNRRLSNNVGSVFINGTECPIIGEISMDSFAVDVSNTLAKEGDLVEIFGEQLSVLEIAKRINTIPYEIYSTLNRRIKRVYSD